MSVIFLGLLPTLALWLVADFEALTYQVKPNFNKSENLETSTATAINYSACYAPKFFFFSLLINIFLKCPSLLTLIVQLKITSESNLTLSPPFFNL